MILMTLKGHLFTTADLLLAACYSISLSSGFAPFCSNLVQFVSSGPVVAMELMGEEAVSIWRRLLGPTDSAVARREAPQCVRAQFGTDAVKNVGHGSDTFAAAARVIHDMLLFIHALLPKSHAAFMWSLETQWFGQ